MSAVVIEKDEHIVERRRQTKGETKRQQILEAALQLMLHDGLPGVTHRKVAALADVPVGSIGYYYASRDLLVDTFLRTIYGQRHDSLRAALRAPMPESPRGLARGIVFTISAHNPSRIRGVITASVEAQREGKKFQQVVDAAFAETLGLLRDFLDKAGYSHVSEEHVVRAIIGAAMLGADEEALVDAVYQILKVSR